MNVQKDLNPYCLAYPTRAENHLLSLEEIRFCSPFPTLLVVDDDEINQKILQLWLEKMNCKVEIASCGYEALHKFSDTIDMILLDIHLPDISGLEVCRLLRQIEPTSSFPILAVTAYDEETIKEECLKVKMSGIITKPLLMKTVIMALKTWLPQKKIMKG